jgi:hypothetical protein
MEFDYAIDRGLKAIVLVHSAPGLIPYEKSEQDPDRREKLAAFREKAKNGRLVRFWQAAEELPSLVSLSLAKTIKTYPAVGWTRANQAGNQELLLELNELRKNKDHLLRVISDLEARVIPISLDTPQQLNLTYTQVGVRDESAHSLAVSLRSLFTAIGYIARRETPETSIRRQVAMTLIKRSSESVIAADIDPGQFQQVGQQMAAHGFIRRKVDQRWPGAIEHLWYLTESGIHFLLNEVHENSKKNDGR